MVMIGITRTEKARRERRRANRRRRKAQMWLSGMGLSRCKRLR